MSEQHEELKPADERVAIEEAWKIHDAHADWAGKVDAKASFSFAIESAAIATVVALTDKDRLFSQLPSTWEKTLYWGGLGLLLIAASFAVFTVVPRLKSGMVAKMWPDNYIYFGHTKYWDGDSLAKTLQERSILPVITRQIVVMGGIAWKKHRWVQLSMSLGALGGALLVLCALSLSY